MLVSSFLSQAKPFSSVREYGAQLIPVNDIKLRPAVLMKIKDLDNLIRLVQFWTMRERTASILHFKHGKKHIMGTITSVPGYYNLEGLPLFLYTEIDEAPRGPFIRYKADPEECWEYARGTLERAWVYIPLIELAEAPEFLNNL